MDRRLLRDFRGYLSRWGLLAGLLVGFVLLFVGGPEYYASRLLKTSWDLGHILFMFLFGVALIGLLARLNIKAASVWLLIYGGVVLLFSATTELLQETVGRTGSLSDLLADSFGAMLALLLVRRRVTPLNALWWKPLAGVTAVVGAIVIMKPLTILYDEIVANYQFPLLAGFETRSELSRWGGSALYERSAERMVDGDYALKLLLSEAGYSGVSLKHFPSNWREFKALQFDIWSPRSLLPITVRIHDKTHVMGSRDYLDRFNRRYDLTKGWNRIVIAVEDIRLAPATRELNVSEVLGVGLFSHDLGESATLYLDQVMLLR